jgi:hypothetical protein
MIDEACRHHGFHEEEIRQLLSIVDTVTTLPDKEDQGLDQELQKRQRSHTMLDITSFDRCGIGKGLRKGRREGRREGRLEALRESVREALENRFRVLVPEVALAIETEADADLLREGLCLAITAQMIRAFWDQVGRRPRRGGGTMNVGNPPTGRVAGLRLLGGGDESSRARPPGRCNFRKQRPHGMGV